MRSIRRPIVEGGGAYGPSAGVGEGAEHSPPHLESQLATLMNEGHERTDGARLGCIMRSRLVVVGRRLSDECVLVED